MKKYLTAIALSLAVTGTASAQDISKSNLLSCLKLSSESSDIVRARDMGKTESEVAIAVVRVWSKDAAFERILLDLTRSAYSEEERNNWTPDRARLSFFVACVETVSGASL